MALGNLYLLPSDTSVSHQNPNETKKTCLNADTKQQDWQICPHKS